MQCMKCGMRLSSKFCPSCDRLESLGVAPLAVAVPPQTIASTFQVVFTGLRPDVMRDEAIESLAALFKTTMEQVHALLGVPQHVLRKGLSADLAVRYQAAIQTAGGVCRIEPEITDTDKPFKANEREQVLAPTMQVSAAAAHDSAATLTPNKRTAAAFRGIDVNGATWDELMPYYDAVISGDVTSKDAGDLTESLKRAQRRERYLESFEQAHYGSVLTKFNWCGAMFPPLWASYRRMPYLAYGGFAVFQVANLVVMYYLLVKLLAGEVQQAAKGMMYLGGFGIAMMIGFGLVSDYLYYRSAKERIRKLKSMTPGQAVEALKRVGGTSTKSVWIFIGMAVVFSMLLNASMRMLVPLHKFGGKTFGLQRTASSVVLRQPTVAKPGDSTHSARTSDDAIDSEGRQAMKGLDPRKLDGIRKAAEAGNAEAQSLLSTMYVFGIGVPLDYQQAFVWCQKSAEQGNANAQYKLGLMHMDGLGTGRDAARSSEWFRKAADQGHVKAQFNLGVAYANGRGVPKDDGEAVAWYRKAAEQGAARAQYNLALMYVAGRGVTQDDAQAAVWFRKAAERGDMRAQNSMGLIYQGGRGVAKDNQQAFAWFAKAAEQGHGRAQHHLGAMYANGEGVSKDMVQAHKWFSLAVKEEPKAEQSRVMAEADMTAEQIAQARELARVWRPVRNDAT